MSLPIISAADPPPPRSHTYRPEIDGLRAVAVLSVIGFHAFPGWIRGGFIGVDVFFVISGFLISGIILTNLRNGTFTFSDFYARRIRRIFPALLIVMVCCGLAGWFLLLAHEFRQLGKHIAAGATFISNFVLWTESGYFDRAAETKPLLHWWSLAIEEQFYIIWPLVLAFVWKKAKGLFAVASAAMVTSFLIGMYLLGGDPAGAFYSPLSRSWELMAGALLAFILMRDPARYAKQAHLLAFAGIAVLGFGILLFNRTLAFPGAWALIPISGAVLVIAAGPDNWINRHLLGSRLLVWFGLISYPLYLWHWPLLTYARLIKGDKPSAIARIAAISMSILLAWLTYVLIEKNVRHRRGKVTLAFLSGAMATGLIIGLFIYRDLIEPRNGGRMLAQATAATADWEYPRGLEPIVFEGQTFYTKKAGTKVTLFIGDSHVEHYSPWLVDLLNADQSNNSVVIAAEGGCLPIPNIRITRYRGCSERLAAALNYARRPEVAAVVIGACWNCYLTELNVPKHDEPGYYYMKNDESLPFIDPRGYEAAMASLEKLLENTGIGKKMFLLLDSPGGAVFNPETYLKGDRIKTFSVTSPPASVTFDAEQAQLRRTLQALAMRTNAEVLDPMERMCANDECAILNEEGDFIYKDDDHLRPFYVRQIGNFLDASVRPTNGFAQSAH